MLFSVDKLINSWKEELEVLKGGRKTRFSELEYRTLSNRSSRPEVLYKKIFEKVLQNSQENISVGVSLLIKLQ